MPNPRKDLEGCLREMVDLCKGTYLDEEAKRIEEALDSGYVLYHPCPETDLNL